MSMALRSEGGISILGALAGSLSSLLPALPDIRLSIPNPFASREQKKLDPRLEELAQQLQDSNGKLPLFINNGILLAVPKKKVSHQKRRQKLYGPARKQLKKIDHLNRCPSCGHYKKSHLLCMNCYFEIKNFLNAKKGAPEPTGPKEELDPVDERILYPGKFITADEQRLRARDYVPKRARSLPYEKKK